MDTKNTENLQIDSATQSPTYEAPAIESVVTQESLEREVQYAGNIISGGK